MTAFVDVLLLHRAMLDETCPCIFAVVFTCETPAVCAKTDQLSLLLYLARGDLSDLLFLDVLAAHMLI